MESDANAYQESVIVRCPSRLLPVPVVRWLGRPRSASGDTVAVEFDTSEGKFVMELDAQKAPKTVENFLQYVENGHYNGTVFHRVIKGFMIQGGGMDQGLNEKKDRAAGAKRGGQRAEQRTVHRRDGQDQRSPQCHGAVSSSTPRTMGSSTGRRPKMVSDTLFLAK